jgi:hypothetical protein
MIDLFRKVPIVMTESVQKDNIYAALQSVEISSKKPKIDLTSGNELSPEGKIFCARLNDQKIPQEVKSSQTTDKMDQLQNIEFSEPNDASNMLSELQKMRLEEAALRGVKEHLIATQKELQNKVIKEMEKTKIEIYSLRSEIDMLETNCKELSELTQTPELKIERTMHLNITV